MTFTRTSASIFSLFGPLLAIPLIFFDLNNKILAAIVGVLFFTIRIYPAVWYVRDKRRTPTWAAAAICGIWGWLVLWFLLKDYSPRGNAPVKQVFLTCENCNKTFYQQDCPQNSCPDCQTQLSV